jgi:ribonuclease HI
MVDSSAGASPVPAGCGAVITAEYSTVALGLPTSRVARCADELEELTELKRQRIFVPSDWQLPVRQLSGEFRARMKSCRLSINATGLLRQFGSYRIVHSRRESNGVADRLANHGIDDAARKLSVG